MKKEETIHFVQWTHEDNELEVMLVLSDEVTVAKVRNKSQAKKVLPKKKGGVPKEVSKSKQPQKEGGCGSCASKGLKRLLTGGAKLLKAELGMDACEESITIDRKNFCESCEHYDFGVCNKCGCFCAAKVKLKTEKCPEGIW